MPLLTLDHISKSFPGVQALSEVSLEVRAGEIHALLGENGAGKSTLMKILCGIHAPDSGEIRLDDQPVEFRNYRDACAAGIGIIFQEFSLIPWLNAIDNIFLGREPRNRWGLIDHRRMRRETAELFERLGIDIATDVPIDSLSVADQQFIEIAKALSLNARLLVLDEPTAPLTPGETERLFSIMRELRQQGVGMVFISHHMEEIFEICDRVTVLRDGTYVGTREVAEADHGQLVKMMVGRRVDNVFPLRHSHADPEQVILEVESIRMVAGEQTDSFHLHQGEILGFAGLVGSGRSEMALGMIGAYPVVERHIRMDGQPVTFRTPADALARGIGLLPENRKRQGLILPFSCTDNITLNHLAQFYRPAPLIHRGREQHAVERLMQTVRIKAPDADTPVGKLSGGNQQKVVIARWLERGCRVLIFDEPTRGIDVGAK
ncbi:sugar ABC transporter ATP-binding protein, partial [Kushneria phosphatilytica]